MGKLAIRSIVVLALLFGLLFAVGTAVLYHFKLPVWWALGFTLCFVGLQFTFGPSIIDWIFKISWRRPEDISPEFAAFLTDLCQRRNIPVPQFGIIEDGNPNAFTYGHVPGDARVVVTRGLHDMLTEEEFNAVVAHEVGHITHYDFVVMTIASLVPMLLYQVYVWTRTRRDHTFLIAVGAFLAYWVSQYIVLCLSRVREYFADEHASQSVPDANAISTALIKIAYGLARIQRAPTPEDIKAKKKLPQSRVALAGSLGICNFASDGALALSASDAGAQYSADVMMRAMQWDLWNPWARLYEISSTHPLVARRVQAAAASAQQLGQTSAFPLSQAPAIDLWPTFRRDLFFTSLPWVGIIAGLVIAIAQRHGSVIAIYNTLQDSPLALLGWPLALLGAGMLIRWTRSYRDDIRPATILDLLGELEVSHINCIPVALKGQIIGRGVPGLFWSKDLVLQDDTGFIRLLYRHPLGFPEWLFGAMRVKKLIGHHAEITGWYRRGPTPYIELREATLDNGTSVRCHYRNFAWVFPMLFVLVGMAIVLL